MTHILLTGAGFTRNWGAWLGAEAFEYLLGCPDVPEGVRKELGIGQNKGPGVGSALARLQEETNRPGRQEMVDRLARGLVGMFNPMDLGLKDAFLEAEEGRSRDIAAFLAKFDAIFSLNQDLFLERKYAPVMSVLNPQRFAGFGSPGMSVPNPHMGGGEDLITAKRTPLAESEFRTNPNTQPYFKLHGSSNWYDSTGTNHLLVMGGNKTGAIRKSPLLNWYSEQFDHYMLQGARLMVIGYSFGDPHINASIMTGAQAGARVFIIDPAGTSVLDQREGVIKLAQSDLMSAVQPALIGASRRPLKSTFGSDAVEYHRVMTFFNW